MLITESSRYITAWPVDKQTKFDKTTTGTERLTQTSVLYNSIEFLPEYLLIKVGQLFRFHAVILSQPLLRGADEPLSLGGAVRPTGAHAHARRQRRPRA